MIFCIVQLSDLHIKRDTDRIVTRGKKIAAAVLAACPNADAYILAMTGDLAFSGKSLQYDLAAQLIGDVADGLKPRSVLPCAIPGNHDLDFAKEPDSRPILMESIEKQIQSLDRSGETVKQILSVQKAFFKFESRLSGAERTPPNQLFYTYRWDVNGKVVAVSCCNTAWMSRNPENPGQLLFPVQAIAPNIESTELSITAFHHPYNWLAPDNKRSFQTVIEAISDVVLTGHEHESQIFFKETEKSNNHYVEGAVLQEHGSEYSAFNCVIVDTSSSEYRADLCIWDEDHYGRREGDVQHFVRNKNIKSVRFRINSEFQKQLTDVGMPLFHPHKEVKLPDIFVYPSFRLTKRADKSKPTTVPSNRAFDHFKDANRVLILGEELSGRTSIAKNLYQDFLSKAELVPVFLRGDSFVGHREASVRSVVKKAVKEQYDQDSVERFLQLPIEERVAIIDDWDEISFSSKGQAAVVENLKLYFGRLFCFASWMYPLEQLTDGNDLRSAFEDFESATINQFGKALTGQFIEKWHYLGREYSIDPRQHDQDVIRSESRIHAVVGQQMLPTYPWYLLSLLQVDSQANDIQNSGALGHVFEALITSQLSKMGGSIYSIPTMYKYLSRIARHLFEKRRYLLTESEMYALHSKYNEAFSLRLDFDPTLKALLRSGIIQRQGTNLGFAYAWCYQYFVALWLAEEFERNASVKARVFEIADRISTDEYTNILMLFLYKTGKPEVLDHLLANVNQIFEECEPCDLDKHVGFINELIKDNAKPLLLPDITPKEGRDHVRALEDEAEEAGDLDQPSAPVKYDPSLSAFVKFIIAFQHLRVLGQVLKNFPGVLETDLKFRIAEASYMLGLRTLRRLLLLAEENLDAIRTDFGRIIKDRHPLATKDDVERGADERLIWLTGAMSYGLIKKICRTVGLEELQPTFEQVLERYPDMLSVQLIDLAIKLEHFSGTPEVEIFSIEEAIRKNRFSANVLRELVSEHLIVRNTDPRVKQRLGDCFELQTFKPQYVLGKGVGSKG